MPDAASLESSARSNAMKPAPCKTRRGRGADMRSSERAAGVKSPDASNAWRGPRADVRSCERAAGVESPDASNTWRDWRANVGNAGAAKLMKIAAVESATRKTRRAGRGAGVEIRRSANPASAKAAGRRAAIDGV
jgi:hypothetical protein